MNFVVKIVLIKLFSCFSKRNRMKNNLWFRKKSTDLFRRSFRISWLILKFMNFFSMSMTIRSIIHFFFYIFANNEISNQSFVISNNNIDVSSLLNLLTLIDIAFILFSKRFRLNISCNFYERNLFFVHFYQRNEIVEIIDQFFFNRIVNDVDN